MNYTKTNWENNKAPAINASHLNNIEDGIYNGLENIILNNNKEKLKNDNKFEYDNKNIIEKIERLMEE